MPRKLRTPKLRREDVAVSRALYVWLLWGDQDAARGLQQQDGSNPWELTVDAAYPRHAVAWRSMAGAAVAEWAETRPGTRPPSWWRWSASAPRFAGESEPAYLDRVRLWLPRERARVRADAFASPPEVA